MSRYESLREIPSSDGALYRLALDEDGMTILLLQQDVLPVQVWQVACAEAVSLIVKDDQSGRVAAVSAEEFAAERGSGESGAYRVPRWSFEGEETPSFREYVERRIAESEQRQDDPLAETTFVHLHTHTEYSPLDGLTTITELVDVVESQGSRAFAITDHGNCSGHPEAQVVADKHGLKAIFGIEAYFVPDRHRRPQDWVELDGAKVDERYLSKDEAKKAERRSDAGEVKSEYTHLTLWAETQDGLRHLWAMSTESYKSGLYDGKPRMDWEVLENWKEGVICGTGCLRGPVSRPLMDGDVDLARQNLLRLHQIFGDRLYIEIHANQLDEQILVNEQLVAFSREYDIPLVAAVDAHYAVPEHRMVHKTWMAVQTRKTLVDETSMFQGDQDYHLLDEQAVRKAISYLDQEVVDSAVSNTVEIARRCTARVQGETEPPVYSKAAADHPDPVRWDVERLVDICLANWDKTVGKSESQEVYQQRFEHEMSMLVTKAFCGYFLVVWDYVSWAKREGCLVGPSRGSGGGSLVAYLMGITEIDPVEADLLFERFMTEGRTSLPDFDIDFPASWRSRITGYITERWGEDYVCVIGTVSRLRAKAAINDVVRAMAPVLPYEIPFTVINLLKSQIDEANAGLAGKQLPWSDFCAQHADLVDPLRQQYPEVFEVVDVVVDRVKTYGKHPAGVVVSTSKPLTDVPMRLIEDKQTKQSLMVTQFDMGAIELLGYVKFDVLTLRNLDTLQVTIDLIHERFGKRVDPYRWQSEYSDPQVWDEIAAGKTLGLFQVETASGTRMIRRMQPRSVADLAAVVTVVRPGPKRSGLTELFLRRRGGFEQVTYPDPRMESFVGSTYGAMIYQEQVMACCMTLAGYHSDEADTVRKLLGKKQVEKVQEAGEEFVRRAVENGTDPEVATHLWEQMSEFAKYCVSGDTEVSLAGTNRHTQTLNVELAWRRLHIPLRDPVVGRPKAGDEFVGPCDVCGATETPHWVRGRCNACYVWRQKFHRGEVLALACYADERIRPARILDVVEQGVQDVWRITLSGGRSIKATAGHRHLTDKGYRMVRDLVPGDSLVIDGGYRAVGAPSWESLSTLDQIVSIEYVGPEQTYDVVMDAPHNFVGNGIVTHNSFGKAHAWAYAVLGQWTAWFKFHFPAEFLTACLSTADMDRIPEFVEECRRMGYTVSPPDVNTSLEVFTADGLNLVYGLSMVKGIGIDTARDIIACRPYESLDDFLGKTKDVTTINMGHVRTLVQVGAFDSIIENRRAVEMELERQSSGEANRCVYKIGAPNPRHPKSLPCSFDWDNEPDPPQIPRGRGRAKVMVAKPPPARCSVACRQYKRPDPVSPDEVRPYTDQEVMDREREHLGVWLTKTPWDRVPVDMLEASDVASKIEGGPLDIYLGVALVEDVRKRTDKNGNDYAFVKLNMQDGSLDAVCFASVWADRRRFIAKDALGAVFVQKTGRGYTLIEFNPI